LASAPASSFNDFDNAHKHNRSTRNEPMNDNEERADDLAYTEPVPPHRYIEPADELLAGVCARCGFGKRHRCHRPPLVRIVAALLATTPEDRRSR
jgi:hypothetical protein